MKLPRSFKAWLVALVSLTAVSLVSIAPMMRTRAQSPPTTYTIIDLETLGGSESKAFAINSCGQVAGYATSGGGSKRPFFRPSSSLIDLGVLSGDGIAKSLNSSGYVVGHSPTNGSTDRAFIWHDDNGNNANDSGEMKQLLPNGAVGSAEDINDNGRVVGWMDTAGDIGSTGGYAGFTWENNTFQLISGSRSIKVYGINNAGSIVGEDSNVLRGFILRNGVFTDIPVFGTGDRSVAYAVSEADHVVGTAKLNPSGTAPTHAFLWTDAGNLKDLGTLAALTHSVAYNVAIVNSSVQVVGTSYIGVDPTGPSARAFVWQDADGDGQGLDDPLEMKDLNTASVDPTGAAWVLQQARSINSSGQIVGYGIKNGTETRAFLLTPTGVTPSPCLPTVNVSVSPSAVIENGGGSLTYTFSRSIVNSSALTINFSIGDTATFISDYTQVGATSFVPPNGSVTIPANMASATITVTPIADSADEPNETVILTVTPHANYTVGAQSAATGTITDDDATPTIQITTNVSSAEPNSGASTPFVFTVSLTNPSSSQITVNYATDTTGATATGGAGPSPGCGAAGVDFVNTSGGLTFLAGETSKQVSVPVCGDNDVEPDETFFVNLSGNSPNSNLPANTKGTGTITNDDTNVTVSLSPLSVTESGAANLVYTFMRTGVTTGALNVNYSVSGTATRDHDYSAPFTSSTGSVTIADGSTTATVTVDPTVDSVLEGDETVTLTVASGTGYNVPNNPGTTQATGTITPDTPIVYVEAGTENNPIPNAIAVDSVTFVRGPFKLTNNWNLTPSDRDTRVILVTSNLGMTQADLATGILSIHIAGYGQIPLANIENVGAITGVPMLSASYIIVKLPADLAPLNLSPGPNNLTLTVKMGSATSNATILSITP